MKKYVIILFSLFFCATLKAQESQTVFSFLRVPVSAHAAALGGDNISLIEDDATLALSNPALLSSVSHQTVTLGYMNYMSGTGIYSASYTHVVNDKVTAGVAAQYLDYGKMTERNALGEEQGTFNPSDLALQGLLSYTLANNLVGGITAKFLYSKIARYTSTAAAIDLGLNYYNPEKELSLSFAVKNLGGQLSAYDDEFENLPVDVLLGASKRLPNSPLRLHVTFSDLNHWDYAFLRHAGVGADLILCPEFYVAAGYSLRRQHDMKIKTYEYGEETESSGGAGLSIGAGLLLDKFKLNVSYGKYHVSSSSVMVNAAFTL